MCRYFLVFSYICFLLMPLAFAETREEIDNQIRVREGRRPVEKSGQLEIDTNKPGFYSQEETVFNQKPEAILLSWLFNHQPRSYTNTINIKVSCELEGPLPVFLPYRFKDIKWSLSKGKDFDVIGGVAQTDSTGKLWFSFISKGSIGEQVVNLEIKEKKIVVNLSRGGPFEISIPMSFCQTAAKGEN